MPSYVSCLPVCLHDNSKLDEFLQNFIVVRCVTSNSWLDFAGDLDHDLVTGIFTIAG